MFRQSLALLNLIVSCLPLHHHARLQSTRVKGNPTCYGYNLMTNLDLPKISVIFSSRHLVSCREHCTVCIILGIAAKESDEMA